MNTQANANSVVDEAHADASAAGETVLDHLPLEKDEVSSQLVTVGAVVVGAALIEVALVPAVLVGAAAVLAPKLMPQVSESIEPAFRNLTRGFYKAARKARSAFGEVQERLSDIVAEVHAEEVSEATPDAAKATRKA